MTYREAVAYGLAQEMERDPTIVVLGEDVGASGGVFKCTAGLYERFGPERVRDTPISEQAIIGAAIGAAMTGLRPVAEVMFADFVSVCHDMIVNQAAKAHYMSNGQVSVPLVVRFGNGGGLGFGAQHSQCIESWLMAVPGLKVVAPSTPADVVGLLAAAIRDPDPVMFLEHKALLASKGLVPDGEHVDELGRARVVREGSDITFVALGAMVPRALEAAEVLKEAAISAQVIDLRSLVPLDVSTVATAVVGTGRMLTVEEGPRLCAWGAEVSSIIARECFYDLDSPIERVVSPHVPLPSAELLERAVIPSVGRVVSCAKEMMGR